MKWLKPIYFLFLLVLLLDVTAWTLEKIASEQTVGTGWIFYRNLIHHPFMWMSVALGPIQLWIWSTVLEKSELSFAYPLSSLSYPMALFVAQFFLREQLTFQVWGGALLITLGVAILSQDQLSSGKS